MKAQRRLRIGGGERRGLKIQTPEAIRPTSSRLREGLFGIWTESLAGCGFLDLFAGSGAVGIEAASRGAARVVLVEGDREVFSILERNLGHAALPGVTSLWAQLPEELERRLPVSAPFDLIFADPPYAFNDHFELLIAAETRLATGGRIALEQRWSGLEPDSSAGLTVVSRRRYGDSGLTIFRRA